MLHKKPLARAINAAVWSAATLVATPMVAQAQEENIEEVVVTGSRIQRANLVSSSPVTQLDAEQLKLTGVTRVEDALAAIPAISLDQSSGQAIESIGTATLELRSLGASRTLVLMNGRRLPTNSPADSTSGADINFIPGQLVERVEVLTGGASSTYGADAVAGVVNFIMMDDFEGIKLDYQMSQFRHENNGNVVSLAAADAGFPFADDTANDGDTDDFTLILGGNFDNGRGNATAFMTYREIEGVPQSARDNSACAVRSGLFCLGSATNQSGSFYFENDGYSDIFNVQGNNFEPGLGPGFNFAPPSLSQRPDKRTVVGTFAHYDLNEQIEAYTELMFMDTRTTTQFGESGVFFLTHDFNCGNPFLSAQQKDVTGCTGAPDDQKVGIIYGRRNVEGGPRTGDLRHTTIRGVFGLRGNINDSWRYDVSYQYAEVDMRNRHTNYVDTARVDLALDAVMGPDGPVCLTGGDCVPYNIFQTGGVTQEMTDYFAQQYTENGTTEQSVWMAYVQGSLGDYGVTSPFAESGVEVVFGLEYRDEGLSYYPSDNALRGEVGGQSTLVAVDGSYDVREFYMEASIPVVEGAAFAQSAVLDLGYRYSDYDPSGETTDTYKFAGSWQFNEDIKLRGSYQRAVRAPNVVDQFQPTQGALFSMDQEPCGGVVNGRSQQGYTFEQCARSGVSQAIWNSGGPADSPAAQYNTIIGGSTELAPEEADTYTLGVILTPTFVEGLTVSLDWYDIEVKGAIQSIDSETTLLQCIENNQFCDLIARGQNDSLWLGQSGPGNGVTAKTQNIGFLRVKGADLEIRYSFDVGDLGTLNINNIMGWIDSYEQEEYPGAGVVNCEGVYGGACDLPLPEITNRMQVTWATPWNVTGSLIWRYIDGIDFNSPAGGIDIDEHNYLDLAGNWAVTDYATLRFGINNVFDTSPPFVPQGVTPRENGNTYPGIYDPLGQYIFLGATIQF